MFQNQKVADSVTQWVSQDGQSGRGGQCSHDGQGSNGGHVMKGHELLCNLWYPKVVVTDNNNGVYRAARSA